MKTNASKLFGCWAGKFLLLPATFILSVSCNEDETAPSQSVSEEEAAEVVFAAMDAESGGFLDLSSGFDSISSQLNSEINGARYLEVAPKFTCGTPETYSLTKDIQRTNGSFSYDYMITWIVNCSVGMIPKGLEFSLLGNSRYDSPRLISEDSNEVIWLLSGLEPGSNVYNLSFDVERLGNHISKTNDQNHFSSLLELNSEALTMNKGEGSEVLGTVTVKLTGTTFEGEAFIFGGILEMKPDLLVLTLNSGKTYTRAK